MKFIIKGKTKEEIIKHFPKWKNCGYKKGNLLNKNNVPWNKNKKYTEEFKSKCEKFGAKKNNIPWNKDSSHPNYEKYLENMKNRKGNKNPCWKGGTKNYPYSYEFNTELKNKIKKRDNYICQECYKHQDNLKYPLEIHHIDYNKTNNKENNLISLCKVCHAKVNWDTKWLLYFRTKIKNGICI